MCFHDDGNCSLFEKVTTYKRACIDVVCICTFLGPELALGLVFILNWSNSHLFVLFANRVQELLHLHRLLAVAQALIDVFVIAWFE